MLMFRMSELKRIALETGKRRVTAEQNVKIDFGVLKYDRIHITNLKSKKLMDNIHLL